MLSSPAMAIRIIEIHPADQPEALNTEWFILENQGERGFSTRGCTLLVHKKGVARKTSKTSKKRKKSKKIASKKTNLGTMDPGFTLPPGEKMCVCTGHPGRKVHGDIPEDGDIPVYSLFLNESILRGPGSVLTLTLRSLPITKATFDPDSERGVVVTNE